MNPRRNSSVYWVVCVVMLTWPLMVRAQNATITGTVTDPSQAPVISVTVTARNTETNSSHSAFTNDSGLYRLVELPAGQYVLTLKSRALRWPSLPGSRLPSARF